jgi:hypothetical protein
MILLARPCAGHRVTRFALDGLFAPERASLSVLAKAKDSTSSLPSSQIFSASFSS